MRGVQSNHERANGFGEICWLGVAKKSRDLIHSSGLGLLGAHMLSICSLVSGEELLTLRAEDVQDLKSLQAQVAKQLGVSRYRQRWFDEDQRELGEEDLSWTSSDRVQLLILHFLPPEEGPVQELQKACTENRLEEVERLLSQRVNPGDAEGLLHTLALHGHWKCLSLLLEAEAPVDREDTNGQQALHIAAQQGHHEVARLLLEAGADKDKVGGRHWLSALHLACQHGHCDMVRLLLDAGADIDNVAGASWSETALHVAAEKGQLEVVRLLLEAGAGKHQITSEGSSALHLAAWNGHAQVAQLLLEAGLDKDHAAKDGSSALHLAVENGSEAVVACLLNAKVDTGTCRQGFAPLHLAASFGYVEIAELLLKAGAEKNQETPFNETALDVAEKMGHKNLVKLLLRFEAHRADGSQVTVERKKARNALPLSIAT